MRRKPSRGDARGAESGREAREAAAPGPEVSAPIALKRIAAAGEAEFALKPDAEARRRIAEDLGLSALRKLSFRGRIAPDEGEGWRLEGMLGATIVQPCVITLEPVTTRIDEAVQRRYRRSLPEPEAGSETPIPEDDTLEKLAGDSIDPGAVMLEALALAIPPFPRREGAELGSRRFAAPGTAPMSDEEARPFAALGALRERLPHPPDEGAPEGAEGEGGQRRGKGKGRR